MGFKFEDLHVWNASLDLGEKIRDLSRKLPPEEKYALCSQMVRCADSIGLNIAEGSAGQTNPEFRRFLSISIRSGIELIACLHIARKNQFLSEDEFNEIYKTSEDIIVQIQAPKNAIA
ncbi:MAG: four helix bundle protein [Bacteroidetes bacterium]|nr:four helix bundle protein [Bacteroidota bacterium]